jgi:hypothetical protein
MHSLEFIRSEIERMRLQVGRQRKEILQPPVRPLRSCEQFSSVSPAEAVNGKRPQNEYILGRELQLGVLLPGALASKPEAED